jgi:hypothetical protein
MEPLFHLIDCLKYKDKRFLLPKLFIIYYLVAVLRRIPLFVIKEYVEEIIALYVALILQRSILACVFILIYWFIGLYL